MSQIKEVERKQFKAIITSEADFRTKIINPLKSWYTNGLPNHLNEDITYYNFKMLYNLLDNKWHNFYTIDDEEGFIRNFRNVMFDLLPTLHFRTIKLKNETQEKIDANAIFTASETSSFKDPQNNFLETQSAESESPETKGKLFGDETRTTAKSYSRTTDKRVNVLEKEDRVSALKNYDEVSFSGEMDSFVNSRQISTLFLDVTDSELAKGSYKIDVEVLREDEINTIKTEIAAASKGEKGEKGDKGDPGSDGASTDLTNYYDKQDVDLRFSTITANYLSSIEINNDFLNKKTPDLNEVMGNIAVPRVILTETPVDNSNQAARMEDVKRAVEGIATGTGNFVETNYFSDNAKLLTRNDKISTETAKIGEGYKGDIQIATQATRDIDIGKRATGIIKIGEQATAAIYIGDETTEPIDIGLLSTGNLNIGSSKWGTAEAPNIDGTLISGSTSSTFREINEKVAEKVDSFVATGNTGAPLGTINTSTSQFFNGGTITTGNTVKLDFIDANYTFTENINPGFSLIRNDTKKLDIGQSNKRVFIKVGVIINSFNGASVGQLEIALNSGNIDIGTDSIVLINPNPNAFFVKTIGVLNSDLVKQEGISISLTSQNGNFVIGGLEVILL